MGLPLVCLCTKRSVGVVKVTASFQETKEESIGGHYALTAEHLLNGRWTVPANINVNAFIHSPCSAFALRAFIHPSWGATPKTQ